MHAVALLHVDLLISGVKAVVLSLKSPVMPLALTLDQRTQETSLNLGWLAVSAHHCSIKLIAFIITAILLAKAHKNALYNHLCRSDKISKEF